jgi:chemotaxis protein MotB
MIKMKNNFSILFILAAFAGILSSCKPHVLCSDTTSKKPEIMSPRYRKALSERDSLCSLSKSLDKQLEALHKEYRDLKLSSGSTVANLSDDLKKKQQELEKKENDLKEKEARLAELERIVHKKDSIMSALTGTIKNALLGFSPDELTVYMKDGKVYVSMSDKLLFKSGSADVESK